MTPIFLLATALIAQNNVDPNRLPIGRPGETKVEVGQVLDLRRNRPAQVSDIVAQAADSKFLLVGESHTSPEHHKMQAAIIDAVAATGRPVVVGFEMFTRPVQDSLNPWTLGWWTEEEFIKNADWKKQWGLDYNLYKPIFDVVKKDRLPMIALNVPRDYVRTVAKAGYEGLSAEQRAQLPEAMDVHNANHRKIYDALTQGHAMTGVDPNHMYAAQVLWDEAMADSAIKYLNSHSSPANTLVVIVAGAGHVAYGQGINWRLAKRGAGKSTTVVMVDGASVVSRGIGDFVYAGPAIPEK